MDKSAFLAALQAALDGLPPEDTARWLAFYDEAIADRMEDGASETEAVAALGAPDEVARQILEELSLPQLVRAKMKPRRAWRAWEIVLLAVGSPVWLPLLLTAATLLFTFYLLLWAIVAVLYALDLSLAAGSLVGFMGALSYWATAHAAAGALCLGVGLFCAGTAIFLFFGCNQSVRGTLALGGKMLRAVKRAVIGRRKNA